MPPDRLNPGPLAGGTGARDTKAVAAGTPEYTSTKARKATGYKAQERWRKRNPLAVWAHSATRSAIRRGLIVKPDRCECCGQPGPVEAHHPDHHDPLRVIWLRKACHKRLHAGERRRASQ